MSTFGCCAAFHTSSASAADDTSRSMARVTIAATREETMRSDVGISERLPVDTTFWGGEGILHVVPSLRKLRLTAVSHEAGKSVAETRRAPQEGRENGRLQGGAGGSPQRASRL